MCAYVDGVGSGEAWLGLVGDGRLTERLPLYRCSAQVSSGTSPLMETHASVGLGRLVSVRGERASAASEVGIICRRRGRERCGAVWRASWEWRVASAGWRTRGVAGLEASESAVG